MIIDAHAHITPGLHGITSSGATRSLAYGRIAWGDRQMQLLPPVDPGPTCFEPETLLRQMDWGGVDGAVLLQGPFYGEQNDYVHRAVSKWPDRFAGAGFVDPRAPGAAQQLRRCAEDYGFRIIKLELSDTTGFCGLYPDLRLTGEELAWFWEECERRNLVVTLDLGKPGDRSYQTRALELILGLHHRLRVVIAHLAQPPIRLPDEPRLAELWREQILLGRHPNVWFDIASVPVYDPTGYPYALARRHLSEAIRLIGIGRLIWGSDAPGTLGVANYPQLRDYLNPTELGGSQASTRLLGETASQVYQLAF